MARAGVVMFLEKNREVTDALVGLLNKNQRLSSLAIKACTGVDYEVRAILPDKVIQAVAQRGPQVLIDILGVIETQMDDAITVLNEAFAAAAATETPTADDVMQEQNVMEEEAQAIADQQSEAADVVVEAGED